MIDEKQLNELINSYQDLFDALTDPLTDPLTDTIRSLRIENNDLREKLMILQSKSSN